MNRGEPLVTRPHGLTVLTQGTRRSFMPKASKGQLDGKPDESGLHIIRACGPWALVRTFIAGQENEFTSKWLKSEHIKIKV